jgi:hypothetical protein
MKVKPIMLNANLRSSKAILVVLSSIANAYSAQAIIKDSISLRKY